MSGVAVNDVRCSDRLPTLNAFQFDMTSDDAALTDASFAIVTFNNVAFANWSTTRKTFEGEPLPFGIPNLLFAGGRRVNFTNVAFNNVTIAGELMGVAFLSADKWNKSGAQTLINVTADGGPVA